MFLFLFLTYGSINSPILSGIYLWGHHHLMMFILGANQMGNIFFFLFFWAIHSRPRDIPHHVHWCFLGIPGPLFGPYFDGRYFTSNIVKVSFLFLARIAAVTVHDIFSASSQWTAIFAQAISTGTVSSCTPNSCRNLNRTQISAYYPSRNPP